MPHLRTIILAIILLASSETGFAQFIAISGPTTVTTGDVKAYTVNLSGIHPESANWTAFGGVILQQGINHADIQWAQDADQVTYFLEDSFGDFYLGVLSVSALPPAPNTTFSTSQNCSNTVVSRTSNPDAAYSWYWQTSATGTATDLGSASSVVRSVSGPLYLRARTGTSPYKWSSSSLAVGTVTVVGTASPGSIGTTTSICPGSNAPTLTSTAAPSGESITIQWQQSTNDGASWSNVASNGNGTSYSPGPLSATTRFRRATQNLCGTVFSNEVTISMKPIPNVGVSPSSQVVCFGQSMTAINLTNPNNLPGTTFSWTVTAPSISNAAPGSGNSISQPLTQSTSVNQVATYTITPSASGCNGSPVNASVTLYPALLAGGISANQIVCIGSDVAAFSSIAAASGGNGNFTYQWQWRSPSGGWLDLAGATSATYDHGSLTSTKEFRRAVSSCGQTAYTSAVTVTVSPLTIGGTVGPSIEAYGQASGSMLLSGQTGLVQKWQSLTGSGSWVDISSNSSTLNYSNVTSTTRYRAVVKSGVCPSINSADATLTIHPIPSIETVEPNAISPGGSAQLVATSGLYSYEWFRGDQSLENEHGETLIASKPGEYKVRIRATSTAPTFTTEPVTVSIAMENQIVPINYITTISFLAPGVSEETDPFTLAVEDFSIQTQYFDGLGRPVQTVMLGQSPMGNDIVQPNSYDEFSRQPVKYLPYAREVRDGRYVPSGIDEQVDFFATSDKVAHDPDPFSVTKFEPSPLNRVLKQGANGEAWQPNSDAYSLDDKTIKTRLGTNTASDKVLLWTYDPLTQRPSATSSGIPVEYALNSLRVKKTYDEDNNLVIEYVDKNGRTILKRVQATTSQVPVNDTNYASTYYIYDGLGNLVVVIPPEAVSRLSEFYHNVSPSAQDTFLLNWTFRYKYDGRRRMTEKQVPGAGPVYMVYDGRNRLVLTQDGNQRPSKLWTFTKYDPLNRPVLTGIVTVDSALTQSKMQRRVNQYYDELASNGGAWFETFVGTAGNIHGYTNLSYPNEQNPNNYLTVTYYDKYDFQSLWPGTYSYLTDSLSQTVNGITYNQPPTGNENKSVSGQITGMKIKVLDGGIVGGYTWLKSVNYYDDKLRLIQSQADNYKGGIDRTSNLYDFSGNLLKTRSTHVERDVTWTDMAYVKQEGNKLVSVPGAAQWGFGASSVQVLPAGLDGWLECIVTETTTNKLVGFNDVTTGNINYGFQLYYTTLYIQENTSNPKSVNGLQPGDLLRIERTGTTIRYFRNGTLIYTSNVASTTDLLVDCSFHIAGNTIAGVRTSFSSTTRSITRRFTYDHAGRIIERWHQVDSNPEIRTVYNQYNELGQLADKKLHSTEALAENSRQSVDYRYNIRGWLTKINGSDIDASALDQSNSGEARDLFGLDIRYNDTDAVGNTPLFNGNISAVSWSNNLGLGEIKESGSLYAYDAMRRITGSVYKEKGSVWNALGASAFAETNITYDLNGNIQSLTRNDERQSGTMDILSYDYGSGATRSNKLLKVTDNGDDNTGFTEFDHTAEDYAYDNNGNLLWDRNKGGKECTRNGNFSNEGADWILTDPADRLNFSGEGIDIITGATSSSVVQNGIVATGGSYVVVVDMQRTSATGFVTVNVGNSTQSVSVSGKTALAITAANTTSLTISFSNTFAGRLNSISLRGLMSISYNLLNLPERVSKGASQQITYVYDASGRKLHQGLVDGIIQKSTDYVGEYFYENDTLQFINHEEGRVVMTDPEQPEYQYYLKDHLGNIRLTFTTKDEIDATLATVEDESSQEERTNFLYYDEAVVVDHELFDHTSDGTVNETYNAVRLVGGDTTQRFGLARSLSVMPGDEINMEVWAKYLDPDPDNWQGAFESFLNQYSSGTAPANTVVDNGLAGTIGQAAFPYASLLERDNLDETAPMAFLTWLVFDRDFNPLIEESGFVQLGSSGVLPKESGSNVAHELLKRTTPLKIKQPGYVYIYLSNENESPVEVFFDDFKVEQIKSPVIQANDYYPFGLTFNSYQSENSVDQTYLYNGKELQDQLDLGWLDYGARAYMPDIGRWTTLDPLLEKFNSFSPYSYCLNNPIVLVDPDGMASKYNWETGAYYDDEDDDGQQDDGERTTTWEQTQKELGEGETPPNGKTKGELAELNGEQKIGPGDPQPREYDDFTQALIEINKYNPLAHLMDAVWGYIYGTDRLGNPTSKTDATISLAMAIPVGKVLQVGKFIVQPNALSHIFRNAVGHVNPTTAASQLRYLKLYSKVASNADNLIPTANLAAKEAGVLTYTQTYNNGEVWVQVLEGKIFNAGVNQLP